jgi:glutamyl-tRNA synthetase
VIRGDDHLTNAARQTLIYEAMGWKVPIFAHVPLIHGQDGTKLSKRHGALGVEAYREMGFLPEAMRNYLARLGWSHGNDEFFTTKQAIEWFDLTQIGKSPARFDFVRLENLSGQHIRETDDAALLGAVEGYLAAHNLSALTPQQQAQVLTAMPGLKERSKTLPQILEMAHFVLGNRPFVPDEAGAKVLGSVPPGLLGRLTSRLHNVSWTASELQAAVRDFAAEESLGLGKIAQPLRVALTGRTVSPSVFDMMEILGRDESLARIRDCEKALEKAG